VDRRSLLDNLDLLMLTVDELVDGGTILETDSTAIVSRVLMYGGREGGREGREGREGGTKRKG